MAENEIGDERKEVNVSMESGAGPKSPWNRPVDKGADAPVMGAASWPALSDTQRPKNIEAASKPQMATSEGTNSGGQQLISANDQVIQYISFVDDARSALLVPMFRLVMDSQECELLIL